MNPIGRNFGFWLLMLMGFFMNIADKSIEAVIFMVGAILFDAIKAIDIKP